MANKTEKAHADEKLSGFMMRNRLPIIIIASVIVAAIIAYSVTVAVMAKVNEKGIAAVDTISYTLSDKSSDLSETDLEARRSDAMTKLTPYLAKGGITGVRANMLAAEIAYQRKDYPGAQKYWEAAASKGKKSYTAPIAYFNEASCFEETGDKAKAAEYYGKAADAEEFDLAAHARFSQGRVYEAQSDWKNAADTYNKLIDKTPDDTWAHLAKTRLIELKNEGKIQ
jgi:tetratricopeptide (TPR) repeat protein